MSELISTRKREKDARNAAEKLKESVKSKATVVRDGSEYEVFHEEICMGDIILLSAIAKLFPYRIIQRLWRKSKMMF